MYTAAAARQIMFDFVILLSMQYYNILIVPIIIGVYSLGIRQVFRKRISHLVAYYTGLLTLSKQT